MKITQGPYAFEHCCHCGSMQTVFMPAQHRKLCATTRKEQNWDREACWICFRMVLDALARA